MKKIASFFFAVSCIVFTACPNDTLEQEKKQEEKKPDTIVTKDYNVSGTITDSKTGHGIAGVPVTDGFTFVLTDAGGKYEMKRNELASKVYYTTPEGYEINLDPTTHLPVFYSAGRMDASSKYVFDFQLTPLASDESHFTLIAVGDPQCAKTSHVNRFKNETIADIMTTVADLPDKNVYGVTLGDIIYDSNDMWSSMKEALGSVSVGGRYMPFLQCIGNHDHDGTVEVPANASDDEIEKLATGNFVDNFGPTDYSFDRKGVHFVVMDDIRVKEKSTTSNSNGIKWGTYNCRLQEHQIEWLDKDLSLVKNKSAKTVVLCMHAPITAFSNPAKVIYKLSGFGAVYVIVGHTHIAEYQVLDGSVIEHILPTACGMWWKTKSDATGSPAGYNVYSFTNGKIDNWYVKGANTDKDYQMAVYDGSQIYSGETTGPLNWYDLNQTVANPKDATDRRALSVQPDLKDCLIADVFASDKYNWTVELYRDGTKVADFQKVPDTALSNICYNAYSFNNNKANVGSVGDFSHRCWYYKPDVLPSAMTPGWEVVATQTIPGTTTKNVYRCSTLATSYPAF